MHWNWNMKSPSTENGLEGDPRNDRTWHEPSRNSDKTFRRISVGQKTCDEWGQSTRRDYRRLKNAIQIPLPESLCCRGRADVDADNDVLARRVLGVRTYVKI